MSSQYMNCSPLDSSTGFLMRFFLSLFFYAFLDCSEIPDAALLEALGNNQNAYRSAVSILQRSLREFLKIGPKSIPANIDKILLKEEDLKRKLSITINTCTIVDQNAFSQVEVQQTIVNHIQERMIQVIEQKKELIDDSQIVDAYREERKRVLSIITPSFESIKAEIVKLETQLSDKALKEYRNTKKLLRRSIMREFITLDYIPNNSELLDSVYLTPKIWQAYINTVTVKLTTLGQLKQIYPEPNPQYFLAEAEHKLYEGRLVFYTHMSAFSTQQLAEKNRKILDLQSFLVGLMQQQETLMRNLNKAKETLIQVSRNSASLISHLIEEIDQVRHKGIRMIAAGGL